VLNSLLNHAIDEKHIRELPTSNMRPLKVAPKVRTLFSTEGLEALCTAVVAKQDNGAPVTKNGKQVANDLRFLAYSGAREKEALAVRWSDVDFDRELLTIGATDATKNHKARTVDFNPKLAALLNQMRRQ
jgi:integrase